jgi:hypothetical protein
MKWIFTSIILSSILGLKKLRNTIKAHTYLYRYSYIEWREVLNFFLLLIVILNYFSTLNICAGHWVGPHRAYLPQQSGRRLLRDEAVRSGTVIDVFLHLYHLYRYRTGIWLAVCSCMEGLPTVSQRHLLTRNRHYIVVMHRILFLPYIRLIQKPDTDIR